MSPAFRLEFYAQEVQFNQIFEFELTHSKLCNDVPLELSVAFLHAKEKLPQTPPEFRKCGKQFAQYVVLRNIG